MHRSKRRLDYFGGFGSVHKSAATAANYSVANSVVRLVGKRRKWACGSLVSSPRIWRLFRALLRPPCAGYTAVMDDVTPAVGVEKQGFLHISVPVGMLQCNCSIIGDPVTREALVVDPGDEVSRILDLLGRHKLKVKAIVSTHAHIDHVGGLSKLHKYTGAPVMMHREDLPLYQAMDVQASFLGVMPPDVTDVHQLLTDGDALQWGSLEMQVIHTP